MVIETIGGLYLHSAYATDAVGSDFSLTYFDGALYLGNYTDSSQTESTNPAMYTWRVLGEVELNGATDLDLIINNEALIEYLDGVDVDLQAGITDSEENLQNTQAAQDDVAKIANSTAQYFWVAEEGEDTGAHITEIPREDFEADPANGGGNLLARSNGIAVRDGLNELATFSATGITMKDSEQNEIFDVSVRSGNITHILRYGYASSDGYGGRINLGRSIDTFTSVAVSIYLSDETPDDAHTYTYTSLPVLINPSTNPDGEWGFSVEQVNNSTLNIVFYSAHNPDEAYGPYIVDNITINYSTNQITSEMDLGAYPDKTMTAPLRIGNGEYDSPSNAFTVDWAGNGLFAGDDIRIGCNPDSSGGTSLVKGEFFNGYYLSQSNAMIVVDVYKVGRLVNLLCTCQRTYAVTVGSNFFTGVVNDGQGLGQVPRPAMEIATGAGFYSQSVIGGFLSIDSNDNLTLTVRNVAGATVNANATVYCTITYVAEE